MFKKHKVKAVFKGFPVCPLFDFEDSNLKRDFLKECYKNGVSLYDVSYVNYSHKENDIQETLKRMEKALQETSFLKDTKKGETA